MTKTQSDETWLRPPGHNPGRELKREHRRLSQSIDSRKRWAATWEEELRGAKTMGAEPRRIRDLEEKIEMTALAIQDREQRLGVVEQKMLAIFDTPRGGRVIA